MSTPTPTSTATATRTPTATSTATGVSTLTPTDTAAPTATATATGMATPPSPTTTSTAVLPTGTPTAATTGVATAIPSTNTATGVPATATNTATGVPATATATPEAPIAISSDPFTSPAPGQHASEVEPDTFAYGDTEVSAFQVGRFNDGGGTSIGWATRRNGVWQHGLLPGVTTHDTPAGPYDRASDPSVAYDAAHGVWLVGSLTIVGTTGAAVVVNRSTDGVDWTAAMPYTATVSTAGSDFYDKDWVVCDNTATSPYYGHCYAEWDDASLNDKVLMSTSTDGGATWGAPIMRAARPLDWAASPWWGRAAPSSSPSRVVTGALSMPSPRTTAAPRGAT